MMTNKKVRALGWMRTSTTAPRTTTLRFIRSLADATARKNVKTRRTFMVTSGKEQKVLRVDIQVVRLKSFQKLHI